MIIHSPIISGSLTFAAGATYTLPSNGTFSGTFNGTVNATNGVVSGSSQVTGIGNAQLTNSSTTIGSTAIALGSSATTIAGLTSVTSTTFVGALTGNASTATALATARTINGTSFDGSANITIPNLVSGSAQIDGALLGANKTIIIGSTSITLGETRTTIAGLTSVTSTGFTGALTGNASTATTAAALTTARTINGTSFDGSANITIPNLVSGSSQITYASISTIPAGIVSGSTQVTPLLPTGTVSGSSQITYASVSSIPAGIVSGSSQLSGTTITDLTIVNLTTINETASVIFSSGSNRFGDAGNDTHSFTGSVQVSGSLTTIGTSTATSFNGTINATNGVVSGSAQIDGSLLGSNKTITIGSTSTTLGGTSTTIAGLTSVTSTTFVGALTGNASTATTAAALTTARTINGTSFDGSANITIPNLVSGSSQVTLSSTTGGGTSDNVRFNSLGIGMAASATAGRIDATNDIVAFSSSDIRFKENIVPIENALDKISKISGNTYDWKAETKAEHGYEGNDVGVIAQEIEAVLPQLVQTRENGFKAVKYDKLVTLLIEGIKEQQKQIDDLTSKVNSLENKI